MLKRRFAYSAVLVMAILGVALIATATPAQAVTFTFTSCHITGGCPAGPFGTVTLTQNGTSVDFVVALDDGNRFVETGAADKQLFKFNATGVVASDIINEATASPLNAVTGGLQGVCTPGGVGACTNMNGDGTGDFAFGIECVIAANCNGGSTPTFTGLTFTVLNSTISDFLTKNNLGNVFVADILCGAAETGCAGLTGPVDVNSGPGVVPEPTTLLMVGTALAGLGGAWRRRRSQKALAV